VYAENADNTILTSTSIRFHT